MIRGERVHIWRLFLYGLLAYIWSGFFPYRILYISKINIILTHLNIPESQIHKLEIRSQQVNCRKIYTFHGSFHLCVIKTILTFCAVLLDKYAILSIVYCYCLLFCTICKPLSCLHVSGNWCQLTRIQWFIAPALYLACHNNHDNWLT